MRKKQLHIVNKYYLPVLAGIEKCMTETYGRFNHDEWDITIHTSADTLNTPNSLPYEDAVLGMKIIRYTTYHGLFIPLIPWDRADIVVLNNFSLVPIMPLLVNAFLLKVAGFKRAKIVLAPHGGFTPQWSHFEPLQAAVKRFLHNQIGRRLINRTVDAVHSVADWEKERLIKAGVNPVRIYMIPNGVEDEAYNAEAAPDTKTKKLVKDSGKYIMTISRIHPLKNIDVVIKALARIAQPVKLLIVGQGHDQMYLDQLYELIRNLGLEGRVVFTGVVTGANKFHLIKNAVALAHMSRFEVDPLVVKEALSQGTICIGANNTGIARLITDGVNGYLLPTFDELKLAETVTFLIENPRNREARAIRKYNLDNREQYRWSTASSQIELLFKNLLPQWSLSYS